MSKTTWKSAEKNRTYFSCGTHKRYGTGHCSPHTIYFEVLEEIILKDINSIISTVSNLKELAEENVNDSIRKTTSIESRINILNNEITRLKKNKLSSYQDYKDELLSKEDYITYSKNCEKQIVERNKMIASLICDFVLSKKDFNDKYKNQKNMEVLENPWITNLIRTGKIDKLDRDVIDDMIDTIYVYDDKTIKIVYNFSDELKMLNVQD